MPVAQPTDIAPGNMTADQLSLPTSARVSTTTRFGRVTGGRVRNGCQVFLNVPYGLDVPRWTNPKPLPEGYAYDDKEYTVDGKYCAQPGREYTLQIPIRDRLGQGTPSEHPFFADIYVPSSVPFSPPISSSPSPSSPPTPLLPVRVFIHGGFLQFGSTSGQHYNQQFFASEHDNEVRVLLGHRLSVLGFMAADMDGVQVEGNYGFKDCWLGLEWVRENISAFGGDPEQVHLSGLSGGAHVVHQLVHRAAQLSPNKAPFITALLKSNAILTDPVPPSLRPTSQFTHLCSLLSIDPHSPTALDQLRDTSSIPTKRLIGAVQNMGALSTFRGTVGADGWGRQDQMEYQRSGEMARDLIRAGVKCIIVGDVRDEDFFYKTVHPCNNAEDVLDNAARYYPREMAKALVDSYPALPEGASSIECDRRMGRVLADGQVHLPVRLLAKDLVKGGMPVVRYTVEYVAERFDTQGYVSHGTDLVFHHLRLSMLTPTETQAALAFRSALEKAIEPALSTMRSGEAYEQKGEEEMLVFGNDGETKWVKDWRWPTLRAAEGAVRPNVLA